MPTPEPFRQTNFLAHLESLDADARIHWHTPLSPRLANLLMPSNDTDKPTRIAAHLADLLKATRAVQQAAFGTTQVADELRRYQKFAKPGQPSAGIVRLRQQQAAARQAANQAKLWFMRAAAAFVREVDIKVPQRVALDVFIMQWIDANVPADAPSDISQHAASPLPD